MATSLRRTGLRLLLGLCAGGVTDSVSAQATQPTVAIDVTPASVGEGDMATLSATVRGAEGRLTWVWDMGDGSPPRRGEDLPVVTHTYRDDGSFGVTLTISDAQGTRARGTVTVRVSNGEPDVEVLTGPPDAATGETVRLEGLATDPGEQDVLTYVWDFGDGAAESGTDLWSVFHAYTEPGVYRVRLTVSDDEGLSSVRTLTIPVDRTFAFEMSGAVGGTIEGGFDALPGFLVHGPDESRPIPAGHCQLSLTAQQGGKMVVLGAALPRPIRPGTFPVLGPGVQGAGFRVQDLQCGNPGVDCSNGLWRGAGMGGSVTLSEATPERIAGEVTAVMEYSDRSYGMSGSFTSVPMRMGGSVLGLDPDCFRGGRFAVAEHHPEVDQANVDPEDPAIRVTFTDPVDRASVSGSSFAVDVRAPDGATPPYHRIEGVLDFLDEHTLRFTPVRELPDGVLPCVRLRGGRAGIRSVEGDTLETSAPVRVPSSRTARACSGGARPWPEGYRWGFATLVELADARVDLYQVVRLEPGIFLVPEKPTAARVYAEWSEKPEFHPDVQVLSFPARVSVEAGSAQIFPAEERVEIRRPDQYTAEERRLARSSVNFFDWRPVRSGATTVRALVEPRDQEREPPRVFEGTPTVLEYWEHAPEFTFDYLFLRVGEWTAGVPEASRASGDLLAKRTEEYTTQMFPVVTTRSRRGEDFRIDLSEQAAAEGREWGGIFDDLNLVTHDDPRGFRGEARSNALGENLYTFMRILTDQLGPHTDANALVAFVPPTYSGGGTTHIRRLVEDYVPLSGHPDSALAPFRTINMYPRGDTYLTLALTHEFGHAFWLQHVPFVGDRDDRSLECAQDRGVMAGIDGIRMAPSGRRGWSKSSTDGNAESRRRLYPLMYPCAQRVEESFITTDAYRRLQEDIDAAIRLGFYGGIAVAGGGEEDGGDADTSLASIPTSAWSGWAGLSMLPASAARGPQGLAASWRRATPARQTPSFLVTGFVGEGAGGGSAVVGRVLRVPAGSPSSSLPEGPYRVVLRSADGSSLGAADFGLLPALDPDAGSGTGYFSVTVPADPDVGEIVVEREGRVLGRRAVSAGAPEVRITGPRAGERWSGSGTLSWEVGDPDGDGVLVTVLYSPTGESPWRAVGALARSSSLTLDAERLPGGPNPTLRVIASDGFHEAEDRVRVSLLAPLPLLALLPAEGDTVDADVEAAVFFGGEVDPSRVEGAVSLTDGEGRSVPVEFHHDVRGRSTRLLPRRPLEPGRYQLVVKGGLTGRFGSLPSAARTSTFHVSDRPGAAVAAADAPTAPRLQDAAPAARRDPIPRSSGSARAPAGATTLMVGETHDLAGGHTLTVHGLARQVDGRLERAGGSERVLAAVIDVEVCAGGSGLRIPPTLGGSFGVWSFAGGAGETRHGWSGPGTRWNGQATFGRPLLDPMLPAGECVRGAIPVGEPARGELDAVVLDTRSRTRSLPPELVGFVAWTLPPG